MEVDQEMRFVCKLCDKRCPRGKSLEGHMRSHVTSAPANSAEFDEGFEPTNMKNLSSIEGNRNSSFGLRENPRKIWRVSMESSLTLPQERVCKQCGKGFQSLKALCGHMACHSEKERVLKDCDHSWTSESQKLVMDSNSDTEAGDPTRLTRSKSKRYKKINVVKQSSFSLGNNNNWSSNNNHDSSSIAEIDELEQEEVAMCLMMLSKDSSGIFFGVISVVESSDNNSVILETKSSSIDMRNGRKNWNCDKRLDFKKVSNNKLKSRIWDAESVQFENINSEYYRDGLKRVESDDSINEIFRKGKYNKSENFDKNYRKGFDRDVGYEKTEFNKNFIKEKGYNSRKGVRDELYDPEVREESVKKKNKYECTNCNKIFSSFQGLGGHRPCHKKANSNTSFSQRYGNGENNLDDEVPDWKPKIKSSAKYPSRDVEKKIKSKKVKAHECPICFRLFKSGQALGGHKRSHFLNGSEEKYDPMPVMKKDLIDLNLPAPEED